MKKSVYKYRGGNFKRDLESIQKNYFFAPTPNNLNDPTEGLLNDKKLKTQLQSIKARMDKKNKLDSAKSSLIEFQNSLTNFRKNKLKEIGIYSLSTTFKDELLWAHYSDSHKGFCIEYDLNLLLDIENIFSFSVNYSDKPPSLETNDFGNRKNKMMIKKFIGHKSKRWEYEEEFRIITDNSGKQNYNPFALKSIYFGINMNPEEKETIMSKLKGRNIQFFQMKSSQNSYNLFCEKVNDLSKEKHTYLKEIPTKITKNKPVKFNYSIDCSFLNENAKIDVELECKISKKALEWVAKSLRNKVFNKKKRLFIYYFIKGEKQRDISWAVTNFIDSELDIKINDY